MASTGCGEILWHNTTMVWLPVLLTEAVCNTSCELYIPCMSSATTVQHKEYCMQLVKVCLSYQICNCMPSDVKLWAAVFDKCCVRLCMCSCTCGCIHVCVCVCIYIYVHVCMHTSVHLFQIIIHSKKKPSWILSFYSETYWSNLQISCMC